MMIWNREFMRSFIAFLMFVSFVLLIIKRKNIEKGSSYFIAAIGLLAFIEVYSAFQRLPDATYNSSILKIVGVNFMVFLLFFLYFQNILTSGKLKKINAVLIVMFLLNYMCSAIIDKDFFNKFPFITYFVEVVLLTAGIYLVMSQTFNSEKILALGNYFPFWACISLMVTYLGALPLLLINDTVATLINLNIFSAILFLVNVAGYTILLFGIFKAKKGKLNFN